MGMSSFDTATEYMKSYWEARIKALNNEQAISWFTAKADSIHALLTETFNRKEANDAWEKKFKQSSTDPDVKGIDAERMKARWLAGCVHDLRMLGVAGKLNRPRRLPDLQRYGMLRARGNITQLEDLKAFIKARESY
jgi:hypothetical protein